MQHEIQTTIENVTLITAEVAELLSKGAVETQRGKETQRAKETQLSPESYVSQIFLVEKKDRG